MTVTALSWFLFSAGCFLLVASAYAAMRLSGHRLLDHSANVGESMKLLRDSMPIRYNAIIFIGRFGAMLAIFGFFFPFIVYIFGRG